ncbi:MAG: sugar phosphate isomerase/epimerase family protein, partial [Chloroflexota bacterium]
MRSFDLMPFQKWILEHNRDLEIQDPCLPALLDADWKNLAKNISSILDGYTGRMGVHGPFFGINIGAFDAKIQQVIRDRMLQALEFAEFIGGTHMVIHSPFNPFGNAFLNLGSSHKMVIDAAHQCLKDAVKTAEAMGCTIVIENIHDKNPAPLLELVQSFESDFVKMSLDTGHAMIMHKMGGGPTPDQWAAAAGNLLGHIHIQDTDGMDDRHWAPGRGQINFFPLFEQIKSLENTPRLILEMDNMEWILEGNQHLVDQGLILH